MPFVADLHVHSHLSRATSKHCDLEGLHHWSQLKGVRVTGTGDFTHPEWFAKIQKKLTPSGPGLFRLRAEFAAAADQETPGSCRAPVDFMLTGEISHIYKRDGRVRKVHTLVLVPDLDTAATINRRLDALGNIKSDGRPILGLDPRDLLEIVLEANSSAFVIPAHIWTPWFSMLGSKSGFDSLDECFGDLSEHIFAVETGLSSDPPMNWRVSSLDRLTLVSNSDLHSPQKLARNANIFLTEPDFFAMRTALREKDPARFGGTLDLFPEEGKYHLDGHRKCGISFEPEESLANNDLCPVCGKPLVLGVLHRVVELADRPKGVRPEGVLPCEHIIPLPELLAELFECGENTKKVRTAYHRLLDRLGPELPILRDLPVENIEKVGPALVGESIRRVRAGAVVRRGGFDGEYGEIRVFAPGEKERVQRQMILLAVQRTPVPGRAPAPATTISEKTLHESTGPSYRLAKLRRCEFSPPPDTGSAQPLLFRLPDTGILDELTEAQREAATITDVPVLVVAGPGTGKTRCLTHRIAWLIQHHGATPNRILAVTFTNRAAREMNERLEKLLSPEIVQQLTIGTFHAFCLNLLRRHHEAAGLRDDFRVMDAETAQALAVERLGIKPSAARKLLTAVDQARVHLRSPREVPGFGAVAEMLEGLGAVALNGLLPRAVALLDLHPEIREELGLDWMCVDEFQDVSPAQYALVRRLCPDGTGFFAIGDPDQAIYGFRGSSGETFSRFLHDYPKARRVVLRTNFRSDAWIVRAASQALAAGESSAASRHAEAAWQGDQKVRVHAARTPAAEAEFITHEIEKWVGGVTHFSMDSARVEENGMGGMTFGDFAVLVRLRALTAPLAEALARLGLPVQVVEKSTVFQSGPGRELLDALERMPGNRRRQKAADGLANFAATVPAEKAHWLFGEAWAHLMDLAKKTEGDLGELLDRLKLRAEADSYTRTAEKVTVLSIHAAKGLEFPVVFLAGCEDGILPYIPPDADEPEDLAEEQRLLYVAMTRGERVLYLTSAAKRQIFGKTLNRGPSRFLEAVTPDTLERIGPGRPARQRPRERQLEFHLE